MKLSVTALAAVLLAVAAPAQAGQASPKIELSGGFSAISTPDAERLKRWWQDRFGFELLREGVSRDGTVRFALLRSGDSLIEILQRKDAEAPPAVPDASYRLGIAKLGFIVGDLDTLEQRLRDSEVRFFHGIVAPSGNPWRSFAVFDPDGNFVQFFGT
jgi:catechol 2,3-dioxygenase-like lactoylglutathione lyase family enzyme